MVWHVQWTVFHPVWKFYFGHLLMFFEQKKESFGFDLFLMQKLLKTKVDLHWILDNFYLKRFLIEETMSYITDKAIYQYKILFLTHLFTIIIFSKIFLRQFPRNSKKKYVKAYHYHIYFQEICKTILKNF